MVDRQHDDAETVLELRMFEEIVDDDLRDRVTLQFDNDANAILVRFVANVADAIELLVVDELRGALNERGLVDVVGDLGNDEAFLAAFDLFDTDTPANLEAATASKQVILDALFAADETARRKI